MHAFEDPPPPPKKRFAIRVWLACASVLLVPSLIVWIVRGVGFALHCMPGPGLCSNIPLGLALHETFNLAWFLPMQPFIAVGLGLAAAIAAMLARRPLLAALSMLVLPAASLALPTMAVYFSMYPGCPISETGIGDCVLWGEHMGMAFHNAAIAPPSIDDFVPYVFALAVMIGIIAFAFFRPRNN
jgi:hypothetical protein